MSEKRIETGPVWFVDDWPGIFIRGDEAFGFGSALAKVLEDHLAGDVIAKTILSDLAETLLSCDVRKDPQVVTAERIDGPLPWSLRGGNAWVPWRPATNPMKATYARRSELIDMKHLRKPPASTPEETAELEVIETELDEYEMETEKRDLARLSRIADGMEEVAARTKQAIAASEKAGLTWMTVVRRFDHNTATVEIYDGSREEMTERYEHFTRNWREVRTEVFLCHIEKGPGSAEDDRSR